jgi:hypothetical protein
MLSWSCEHHGKIVIIFPLGGTHSKWPWAWALVSPLGEEHRSSSALSLKLFLNGDVAPLGVNFGKQISPCTLYLSFYLFACETNFLGFELDLLIYKHLVWTRLWEMLRRNPWYLQIYSISTSCTCTSVFIFELSYPNISDIISRNSRPQVRSIRTYIRSIRIFGLLTVWKVY